MTVIDQFRGWKDSYRTGYVLELVLDCLNPSRPILPIDLAAKMSRQSGLRLPRARSIGHNAREQASLVLLDPEKIATARARIQHPHAVPSSRMDSSEKMTSVLLTLNCRTCFLRALLTFELSIDCQKIAAREVSESLNFAGFISAWVINAPLYRGNSRFGNRDHPLALAQCLLLAR